MIQDIYPHKLNNNYQNITDVKAGNFIFYFHENAILLKRHNDIFCIPQKEDFRDLPKNIYLFNLDSTPCFLLLEQPATISERLVYEDIHFYRTIDQPEIAWAGVLAYQLFNWYMNHKYCGRCGSYTEHKSDERALICLKCKNVIYPCISPAIIVAIVSGDKILLARGSNWPEGRYSLVAGYVDMGEPLEETVKREVKEEVGLSIKNVRYFDSQPWPLSSSLMIGFIAEADENQQIVIDENEIADARWFARGHLPDHPPTLSIAGVMIELFEKGELL